MEVRRRAARRWGAAERRTAVLGALASAATLAVIGTEVGRVWRRGKAPLPQETESVLSAAEEAVAETVEVAVVGYQDVSSRENALFNMLVSFVASFVLTRLITHSLRARRTLGPFRNLRVGRRHIHHFVPGIVLAFGAGAASILTRNEEVEPRLALVFGAGMGLTLDESALLLELDDVYWSEKGLLSVQITMAVTAMMAALALAARFLRRGEQIVLEHAHAPEAPAIAADEARG
jgi:hypothetical protein